MQHNINSITRYTKPQSVDNNAIILYEGIKHKK